jgi:16S rRNA (guanine966-N2)-methyltransferase
MSVRIVAGAFRGRRLRTPPGKDVRPTSDRAREALFNILHTDVEGADVLDLYAGTGALGLEAISRGAGSAVLVEASRPVYEVMKANAESLPVDETGQRIVTMHADAKVALKRMEQSGASFDLLLLDPPYKETVNQLSQIAGLGLAVCAPGATLVVECAQRNVTQVQAAIGVEWQARLVTTRRYGDTAIVIAAAGE